MACAYGRAHIHQAPPSNPPISSPLLSLGKKGLALNYDSERERLVVLIDNMHPAVSVKWDNVEELPPTDVAKRSNEPPEVNCPPAPQLQPHTQTTHPTLACLLLDLALDLPTLLCSHPPTLPPHPPTRSICRATAERANAPHSSQPLLPARLHPPVRFTYPLSTPTQAPGYGRTCLISSNTQPPRTTMARIAALVVHLSRCSAHDFSS